MLMITGLTNCTVGRILGSVGIMGKCVPCRLRRARMWTKLMRVAAAIDM